MTEYVPLREAGLSIMPLPYGQKAPPPDGWDRYCIDRADDAQTDTWFGRGHRNIAVACGPASGGVADGLVVLVFNSRELYQAFTDGMPPGTWIAESVRGPHIYLRIHGGLPETRYWTSSRTGSLKVLELRSTGAYVVAPDSRHPVGVLYAWAQHPAEILILQRELFDIWLADRLDRARSHGWSLDSTDQPHEAEPVSDDGDIGEGGRNVELTRQAGKLRRQGFDEETILAALHSINERRCKPPLGDDEVQRIAASVARYEPEPDGPTIHLSGHTTVVGDDEWGEPSAIDGPPAAPRLPLKCFPPAIVDWASDIAERQSSPIDFALRSLLAFLCGLIGRNVGIRPKLYDDWTERAALWVALIGDPSSLKSPSYMEARHVLERQAAKFGEVHQKALAKWKAQCDKIKADKDSQGRLPPKPVLQRCWTSDFTTEKLGDLMLPHQSRGMVATRDELTGLLLDLDRYHARGGDRQFLLESYSGGSRPVDRMKDGGTFIVPDILLSVVGGIQPARAREVFGSGPDDGLGARFLSIWPELDTYHRVDRFPNKAARDAYYVVADALARLNWGDLLERDEYKPYPFCRLDSEAARLFGDWETALLTDLRGGRSNVDGRLGGRQGKYSGVAARILLVCHLVEFVNGPKPWSGSRAINVNGAVTEHVLEVMTDYVVPMERRVYAAYAVSRDAELAGHIGRWIERHKPEQITAREARRAVRGQSDDPQEIGRAIEWLCSQNWLREKDQSSQKGRRGPQSEVYLVNPRVCGQ